MLWEKWIPKSQLVKSSVGGIECVFKNEEEIQYNLCIVNTKKSNVDVHLKQSTLHLSEVLGTVKKHNVPLLISITGKGVITKKIIFSESDSLTIDDLVKQYLPTIQKDDFYIQFYKSSSTSGHIAICRKEQADTVINFFSEEKQECVNLFIGPLICNAIAVLTSSFNKIDTMLYELELTNGFVDSIQVSSNKTVQLIDELAIEKEFIVAFASCFGYLTIQSNYDSDNSNLTRLPEQHLEKNKIKIFALFLLVFFFLMSAVNSVLFFGKFEEDSNLQVELNLYESKNSQITQLLESYQKKKNLIEQTGIFSNNCLSIYADKIAASLPADILLKELYFNPITEETAEDSLADFKEKQLIIKGNCNKSLLLNDWINVLKSQNFIQTVNLENFFYNSEGEQPNFILKLEIK